MKPETRKEAYLAAIGGQDVDVPAKPITREEAYLAAILNNGLGAKNLEDLADVQIVDPVNGYVVKFDAELGKWVAGPASGSGGTSDYTDLANKPQINGNTLAGDKSAEDLGLAGADDIPTKVSDLDNDEDFISDADYVHTDNNYDDTAKGIVGGVTEALAGKQDKLIFDNIPTANSTNPVKSGGVYAVDEAIRKWTTAEAKSVSGNPITLTDGSARNAEELSVVCNPKQNLHGYDHPWAGGAGKNKLPLVLADIKSANTSGTWNGNAYTLNGVTFTVQTDADNNVIGVTISGANNISGWTAFNVGSILVTEGTSLKANTSTTTTLSTTTVKGRIDGYNGNTFVSGNDVLNNDTSYTVPSGVDNVRYTIYVYQNYSISSPMTIKPMLRLSTVSDATFEPYTNECPITGYTECVVEVKDEDETTQDTATITFGQTVYGGSVDFKTGKVTVTHVIADLGSINYTAVHNSGYSMFYSGVNPFSNMKNTGSSTEKADAYCSAMLIDTMENVNLGRTEGLSIGFDDCRIRISSKSAYMGMNAEQFKTAMDGVHLCYELATPIILQLTPAELELLKGYNYITTNGTTIALAYLPDSLLAEAENYVDAKIPPAPTTDGTYVLTCTVTDGTPAYSWESAT